MIKLFTSKTNDKIVCRGIKGRFSLFNIEEYEYLRYGVSEEKQERILFYQDEKDLTWSSESGLINSGLRTLRININSTEELKDLERLFLEEGFKVRVLSDSGHVKERVWFSDLTYDLNGKSVISDVLLLDSCCLMLWLRRKELRKLLGFLRKLSREYGYRVPFSKTRYKLTNIVIR